MPLFESQKSRNGRLFMSVGVAFLKRLKAWLAQDMPEDKRQYYRVVYRGWIVEGTAAAEIAVSTCESLKDAWGKGNERKACALSQVFTLAMISRWYRRLDEVEPRSEVARKEARRIASSNVLTFFGDYSQEAIDRFMKVDAQLNYDDDREDKNREGVRIGGVGYALLRAMAEEACGGPRVELGSITFPWEGTFEALEQRGIHLAGHFFDSIQIGVVLMTSAARTFEHYAEYYKVPNTHESQLRS